jgi:hypothetical protein
MTVLTTKRFVPPKPRSCLLTGIATPLCNEPECRRQWELCAPLILATFPPGT